MTSSVSPEITVTRIGADIGGTFTDVAAVGADGILRIGKRLTSHGQEQEGTVAAIADSGVDLSRRSTIVAHGTTLVINALLERHGARTALVATKGFGDVLDIGRANRTGNFDLRFHRPPALIPRELRFELTERTLPDGQVLTEPDQAELAELIEWLRSVEIESVALAFINSYANPENELRVASAIREQMSDVAVTMSSDLSRQWGEFERSSTAAANAFVAPVSRRYLEGIVRQLDAAGFAGEFVVLDSSGGSMRRTTAARFPIRMVESGPVGGVIAARGLVARHGIENVITLDIGGTTAKAALIEGGEYATTNLYWVGGESAALPLQVSTVDIIEIGIGGGSIAWRDPFGRLQVGPRSAGSNPGPACYARGGTHATLTDANVYCGRIDPRHFSADFELSQELAARAIETLAAEVGIAPDRLALGIIRLATLGMASTVRPQTLERGNDPRDYTLLASGGGGPLHGYEVSREVGIQRLIVPQLPGHYSALGMLEASLRTSRVELYRKLLDELDAAELNEVITRIATELTVELEEGLQELPGALRTRASVAVRFVGQEHPVWIPVPSDPGNSLSEAIRADFEQEYLQRYGHLDRASGIEVSELEVVVVRELPAVEAAQADAEPGKRSTIETIWQEETGRVTTPVIPRNGLRPGDRITGPAIVYEIGSTFALPPGGEAEVLYDGVISVTVAESDD